MKNKKPSSYQVLKTEYNLLKTDFDKASNIMQADLSKKPVKGKAQPISSSIPIIQTLYRIRTDISTWRSAIMFAENIQYPVRLELYRLYKEIMLDAHLSAAIGMRKSYSLGADYIVTRKGKEVPELTEKIKSKWFYDFVNLSLDSIFFGFSLIEFDDLTSIGEFSGINLIPRQYVKPEFGIVGATPASLEGESYLSQPWSNWVIGVGENTDLGLLAKLAPLVLWKRGAEMAYAEYSEMFGTPIRILKTDSFDEETRQAGENFMRNMATSAYAVIGKEDEVQLISDKQASGVEVMFNGLIDKMNSEMSKLILGGTALMEEKSFVGSSKIHQESFDMICIQDKIMLENIFKYQLVDFLNIHGFGFEGCKIERVSDDELTLLEKFSIEKELLKLGFDIDPEYLNKKYGVQVTKSLKPIIQNEVPLDKNI